MKPVWTKRDSDTPHMVHLETLRTSRQVFLKRRCTGYQPLNEPTKLEIQKSSNKSAQKFPNFQWSLHPTKPFLSSMQIITFTQQSQQSHKHPAPPMKMFFSFEANRRRRRRRRRRKIRRRRRRRRRRRKEQDEHHDGVCGCAETRQRLVWGCGAVGKLQEVVWRYGIIERLGAPREVVVIIRLLSWWTQENKQFLIVWACMAR